MATPPGATMDVDDWLRYLSSGAKLGSGLSTLLPEGYGDWGKELGQAAGPLQLGAGIASGDPWSAVGGVGGTASLLSNIPGLENLASAVPYIGPFLAMLGFGRNVAGGNPATILPALPALAGTLGTAAGTGALGATMAAAAPALSTVGAFAIPAAAAAYFATNTQRKDMERKLNELHEWQTARRDLPTTARQQEGALRAHTMLGDDTAQLTDEQLRHLTGQTQSGLLSLVPGGHALMQLGAGEEFAGIPGMNVDKPAALAKVATLAGGRDYMREADEFSRRGLTLGGDVQTAMHGSIYDSPEAQQAVNAPNAADMLKDWAIQFSPESAEAKKVNQILDASRTGTAQGGAIENVAIPDFNPGNYAKAFDAYTANILNQPVVAAQPDPNSLWAGGVYRGRNPDEYVPYGGS